MFGSRRFKGVQHYDSTDSDSGSDFVIILSKSEFQPGQFVTFEVNARNGNAVRLNLYAELMQTSVFLRRGKYCAERIEIGSVMSRTTFSNMVWHDQIFIPPGTPPTKRLQPNQSVPDGTGFIRTVVEIRYSLVLSTRVESVKLIRDEVDIRIVSPNAFHTPCSAQFESFGNQNQPQPTAPTMVETEGPGISMDHQSFRSGRSLPWRSGLDTPPPHYSILSLHLSSLYGSVETLPPSYEDATKE